MNGSQGDGWRNVYVKVDDDYDDDNDDDDDVFSQDDYTKDPFPTFCGGAHLRAASLTNCCCHAEILLH